MTLEPVTPRLERLCRATVEIAAPLVVGDTPLGRRRIIPITGGRVEGPRLRGVVLPGGADWQIVRGNGERVDPATYYFRTTPRFETGAHEMRDNPNASTAMLQILGQAPRVVWPKDVAEQKFVFPRPRA
jgi:hypothetical protein